MNRNTQRLLGIDFFSGTLDEAVAFATSATGCIVMPAAPALVKLNYDDDYRRALLGADLVLPDSGFVAVLSRLATHQQLSPISGVDYLRRLLALDAFRTNADTVWLVRSAAAKEKALAFLEGQGIAVAPENILVVASLSAPGADHAALLEIEARKPRHVVIALSQRQEQLGIYLRDYLLQRPTIHCVGAALGFLTGDEKPIPQWAQRRHLGWLARLAAQPSMLLPRAGIACALTAMVLRYRADLPPLRTRWTDV